MLKRYYEQELAHLRELAVEFSKAHPVLAPMLSGPSSDPDVERLLEGVAFLTGLVRARVDDEFPEFVQTLGNLVFPHYLRPIPACTMISFAPKGRLNEPATVPAGVELASVPVDGTACVFRTCHTLEVQPLVVREIALSDLPGAAPELRLSLSLSGLPLANWPLKSLRLFLADTVPDASLLYCLLSRFVAGVSVTTGQGPAQPLPLNCLRPVGFREDEVLLPYPPHAYPGYRVLQEYFVMPEKFLFMELSGLENWQNRGNGSDFDIVFQFTDLPSWAPRVHRESILLNVVPAINLFTTDAEPIMLDHRRSEYLVTPSSRDRANYQIFSVDQIVGQTPGSAAVKTYHRFGFFHHDDGHKGVGTYEILMRPSTVERTFRAHLSVAYPPGAMPQREVLSAKLTCTNGHLTDGLHLGDISKPTDSSPERLSFRNIRPPTAAVPPLGGDELLARLLSHLSLNYLSIASADNLRALLHLYVTPGSHERGADSANRRRIQGIQSVEVKPANRIVGGVLMRGQHIVISCRSDHYAGYGDLFLFGVVLDRFLADYAALNTYTRLEIIDVLSGDRHLWPERIGQQFLM